MPTFDTSNDGLIAAASWLIKEKLVMSYGVTNAYIVNVPSKPLPFSCRLFWKGKEHYCSCGKPSKPCAHLIACLVESGTVANIQDVFNLKKRSFTHPGTPQTSRKQMKGSSKTPATSYYKNPAVQPMVTPLILKKKGNNKGSTCAVREAMTFSSGDDSPIEISDMDMTIFKEASSKADISDTSKISNKYTTQVKQMQFLRQDMMPTWTRWDSESKLERSPKYLLQFIHRLAESEVFHVEDSFAFGRLGFFCPKEQSIVVFTTKTPNFQLIEYAASLVLHQIKSISERSVEVTILVDEKFNKEEIQKLASDNSYLRENASILTKKVEFATCCWKAIDSDKRMAIVNCETCQHKFHCYCVQQMSSTFDCGFCSLPKGGIK
jgi:hypothetical protein